MDEAIAVIIAVCLVIFVLSFIFILCKNENEKDVKMKQNGIEITFTKDEYTAYLEEQEIKRQQEKLLVEEENKKRFYNKCRSLDDKIQNVMKSCNDIIRMKVLQGIYELPTKTEEEYELKEWLFNNGELRSNEEVSERQIEISNAKHRESFNTERHTITAIISISSFSVVFMFIFFLIEDFREVPILGIPIALVPALFAALIGGVIGHTINISNAKRYGIPDSDPRVQSERISRGVDIGSTVYNTVSLTKKAKNAVKEIGTPDSWNEMK